MKSKKLIALFLAAALVIASVSAVFAVFADDVTWSYDSETSTLYIGGSGNMDDYARSNQTPWSNYLTSVRRVVVGDGVTSVGNNAFAGADILEEVTLADSVASIGTDSFASCPELLSLTLSPSVISIGNESFAFNGSVKKNQFLMYAEAGSYALTFAYRNDISFVCEDIKTGTFHVNLQKGMTAYFPYTCKYSGQYKFYSVSKHDSIGYIYDSSKAQVAYNDDHGTFYNSGQGSTDFGITKTLNKGERYYLAVKVFNPSLTAHFDVYFEPVQYTVSGTLCGMKDTGGITLTDATMDGTALANGSFTVTVNGLTQDAEFECNGVTLVHSFSVDDGDSIVIVIPVLDVNSDGIVNAKDYAKMRRDNSAYIGYFDDYINFRC